MVFLFRRRRLVLNYTKPYMSFPNTYWFGVLVVILIALFIVSVFFLVRLMIMRSQKLPLRLFNEALKNENECRFEQAEQGYRFALDEVEKKRMKDPRLKNKILEKLKTLRTVIEYNGRS